MPSVQNADKLKVNGEETKVNRKPAMKRASKSGDVVHNGWRLRVGRSDKSAGDP